MTLCNAGSKNAKVLPEPVFDDAIKSLPANAIGSACSWMAVGSVIPICFML